ncbi:MAG: CHAP domain-containing protein, partial [Lachnospiraceae bacterium]|nr:CHAP domain-containing protein [Lachnospiraceae bacterium]
ESNVNTSVFASDSVVSSVKSHFEDYKNYLSNAGLTLASVSPHMTVTGVSHEGDKLTINAKETLRTSCSDSIGKYNYDEYYNITIVLSGESFKISSFSANVKCQIKTDDEEEDEEGEEDSKVYAEFKYVKSTKILPLPELALDIQDNAVNLAISQLGFIEGTDNDNAYAESLRIANNQKWCMSFVTWCAYNAGIDHSNWPSSGDFSSSSRTAQWFSRQGRYHSKSDVGWSSPHGAKDNSPFDKSYKPKPGDVVVFDTNGNLKDGPDHAGIYIKNDGTYYYTIEGNTGSPNGVYWRKYNISNLRRADHASIRIMGFCNPDYSGTAGDVGKYYKEDYDSAASTDKSSENNEVTEDVALADNTQLESENESSVVMTEAEITKKAIGQDTASQEKKSNILNWSDNLQNINKPKLPYFTNYPGFINFGNLKPNDNVTTDKFGADAFAQKYIGKMKISKSSPFYNKLWLYIT